MERRSFIRVAAGMLTTGVFAACAPAAGRRSIATSAATFRASQRTVQTRFGRIACIDRGSGATALFLHGFPLSSFQWHGAIERLAIDRRCLAPDFLGLGNTEVAPGQSVDPDAQTAMLIALLDQLSISQVDLVASDSGGAVAQLLVARHPARVRTLLLTNCDTEIDSPPPALAPVIEMARAGTYADAWLARWHGDTALARSQDGIGGMCYTDPAHPTDEAIETYFAPLVSSRERKTQVHAYTIALARNALVGVEAVLKRSRIPTRIVWGTADTIFSAESPDYLDRVFGNSRGVRRLAGRKLFWPEELPGVVAEEARQLWNAVP